mgnify:CR=1 FL=1
MQDKKLSERGYFMKKNSKLWLLLLTFAFVVSMLVACGGDTEEADSSGNTNDNASEEENNEEETNEGNTENNSEEADNPEEITLKWAHQWGEENFEDTIGRFVRDEFPHITFEIQEAGTDHPETLENLIAAKDSPDIVTMGLMTHAPFMEDLGLAYDMDELIEQEGFDLSRFEPSIIEFARNQDPTDNGGLYSLPIARPTFSLHYNRDVFDMVGVSYPTDDMTWSEVIYLAREVTREMNGVQYRGLDLDVPYDAYTQFSQNSVDPETDEVLIQESEAYRRYLEMIDETVSIPGNYPADDPASVLMNWGSLFGEGNIAMFDPPESASTWIIWDGG